MRLTFRKKVYHVEDVDTSCTPGRNTNLESTVSTFIPDSRFPLTPKVIAAIPSRCETAIDTIFQCSPKAQRLYFRGSLYAVPFSYFALTPAVSCRCHWTIMFCIHARCASFLHKASWTVALTCRLQLHRHQLQRVFALNLECRHSVLVTSGAVHNRRGSSYPHYHVRLLRIEGRRVIDVIGYSEVWTSRGAAVLDLLVEKGSGDPHFLWTKGASSRIVTVLQASPTIAANLLLQTTVGRGWAKSFEPSVKHGRADELEDVQSVEHAHRFCSNLSTCAKERWIRAIWRLERRLVWRVGFH